MPTKRQIEADEIDRQLHNLASRAERGGLGEVYRAIETARYSVRREMSDDQRKAAPN